jgi:CheY-like chemotaxis protein
MSLTLNGLKILLVDDYRTIRKKLRADLEPLGLVISEAANGVEALEWLKVNPVDLVVTDLVMPEMDGFELCLEIRKNPDTQDLPIVVISTHCDVEYIMKALRLGADDYLTKPTEPDLAARVFRRVLTPTMGEMRVSA